MVRYDDEIRAAAEKLFPFGDDWVERLGAAFFALSEDRKYLPNIVERLTIEAERDAAVKWLLKISKTYEGEDTSKQAIAVLLDARLKGYVIDAEPSGIILYKKDGISKYLYSNDDILQFGKTLSEAS